MQLSIDFDFLIIDGAKLFKLAARSPSCVQDDPATTIVNPCKFGQQERGSVRPSNAGGYSEN